MTGAARSLDICTSACADSCKRHRPKVSSREQGLLHQTRIELLNEKDSSSRILEKIWDKGTNAYNTTPFDTASRINPRAARETFSKRCHGIDRLLAEILDYNEENSFSIAQAAKDISDKFELWKSYSGSTHPPLSELSLEYRLTNAPHLEEEFDDLLGSLREALQDAIERANGSEQNHDVIKEIHGTEDEVLEGREFSPLKPATTTEIQDLLEIASNTVRCLLRLVTLVQKAPPRHINRFAVGRQHYLMISFDTDYVKECHPKLDRPETWWLVERLGRANNTRRQFFWSLRERGESRDRATHSPAPPSDAPKSRKALEPSMAESQLRESDSSEMTAADKSLANRRPLLYEDTEDAPTQVSVFPSVVSQPEDKPLSVPRLEDIKREHEGKESFRCPLCAAEISIDSERSWMLHAHKDLKSYVCCLGEGQCDSLLFDSQEAWFNHELKHHRRQWICIVCKSGPFHKAEELTGHLAEAHPDLELSDEAKEALQDASQRPIQAILAKDCPFCDDWDRSLRSSRALPDKGKSIPGTTQESPTVPSIEFRGHVAVHLEHLAVSSVSRGIIPRTDPRETNNDKHDADPLRIDQSPASGDQDSWYKEEPPNIEARILEGQKRMEDRIENICRPYHGRK